LDSSNGRQYLPAAVVAGGRAASKTGGGGELSIYTRTADGGTGGGDG